MKKKQKQKKVIIDAPPFISICTPTYNRRPFIPMMLQCFRNQDYPKNCIEWIIVDDGTDKIKDLIDGANISQIKYYSVDKKMTLGAKRNYMHSFATGSIIIYMDDDDYYPPERISHAVEMLEKNKQALCAGSTEIYVYFKDLQKMMQCGPYGPNHATAATFAFRKELLDVTRYDDNACLAEEQVFLKNYTIPFVQLEPLKTILVFSHDHNSFDKKRMFGRAHPNVFKESSKTISMFIRNPYEKHIMNFFLHDIDNALKSYKHGEPTMKTDVLNQIIEIENKQQLAAEEQLRKQQNAHQSPFVMELPNGEKRYLTNEDIITVIQEQKSQIELLTKRNKDLNELLQKFQAKLMAQYKNQVASNNIYYEAIDDPLCEELANQNTTIIAEDKIISNNITNNDAPRKIDNSLFEQLKEQSKMQNAPASTNISQDTTKIFEIKSKCEPEIVYNLSTPINEFDNKPAQPYDGSQSSVVQSLKPERQLPPSMRAIIRK